MARIIFYSWQNDLPSKSHRNFIDSCIRRALKSLEKEASVYMEYDRDTMGLMGSPDIADSIFEKINKAVLFVCDVSLINAETKGKKTPNPNVLIELGYAASKLGWDRIICLFDENTGKIEELPFDIRQKRITLFNPDAEKEKERIAGILSLNIKDLFVQGKLFNPLNDYMKGKIDKSFLDIGKQLSNLIFGTFSLSEGLGHMKELLNLSYEAVLERMCLCEFPAFVVLNTYESTANELREILKDLFSSSYFPKEWAYCVLELLDWIRDYDYFVSERNPQYPFSEKKERMFDGIAVISAQSVNPSNPPNSKIVLRTVEHGGKKYIEPTKGRVINTTEYPCNAPSELSQCYTIKKAAYPFVAKRVYKYIALCRGWLDITDSEFVLDPDTYYIK